MEDMLKRIAIVFLVLLALCLSAAGQQVTAGPPASSLAYVLDSAGHTLTAVDLVNGKTAGSVAVGGRESLAMSGRAGLDTILLSPDGSRLIRLDPGAQKFTLRFGLHPLEKSTLTVIDAKTMRVSTQVELGWGLSGYQLSPDRKVMVAMCSGYTSQKPEETLPTELVTVNLADGKVLGRLALARQPLAYLLTKDGATALVLYAQRMEKRVQTAPTELEFINVAQQSVAGKITLDGAPDLPVLAPTGDYLYLIERGQPSPKPDKNVAGRIHVISLKGMKEETILDAGTDPRGVLADEAAGQTLLLSSGAPIKGEKKVDGELRVIRGAALAKVLKVGYAPEFIRLSPDRKRLYVICWSEFAAIDYQSLSETGRLAHVGSISELAFAPDGKLGFALHPASSKLSIFDLGAMRPVADVTTGRAGIKFAKNLGAAALTAASVAGAYGQAYNMASTTGGYGYGYYHVFTVAPANTQIAVKPDGAFVYVLNSQTNDVTVVNTATSTVVDKIAAGGRRLQLFTGAGVLGVVGRNSLHRVDTGTQKGLPEIPFEKNLWDVRLAPDGKTALALVDGSVFLLNGATGEVRTRIEGFKHPRRAIFGREEAPPEEAAEEEAPPEEAPAQP